MSLIKNCTCGGSEFTESELSGLMVRSCRLCGVFHQVVELTEGQYGDFYKNEYHNEHQKELGRMSYEDRYQHDRGISEFRLAEYKDYLSPNCRILDIGSGNNAFVDEARAKGYQSYGCDMGLEKPHKYVLQGELKSLNFPTEYFDVVTFHDSLEHIVDPIAYLKEVRRILKPTGILIVDYPNYWDAAGAHHWRPIQHLWFHTVDQLGSMLESCGFAFDRHRKPIASKQVVYFRPKASVVSACKILLLSGMGDIYWVMVKLQDFIKKNNLGIPEVYVWDFDTRPRSMPFLEKFPFIKAAGYWRHDTINPEFHAAYIDGTEWIYPKFRHFDYFFSMNSILRHGMSIDRLSPRYESNWYPPMYVSPEEKWYGEEYKKKYGDYVVGYFSHVGMFQTWMQSINGTEIFNLLKEINKTTKFKVLLSGSSWDDALTAEIKKNDKENILVDLVGKTDNDQFFGLVKQSRGMLGWCGGNTIMSTVFKKPTIIVWSRYFRKKAFYEYACPPDSIRAWYHTVVAETYSRNKTVKLADMLFREVGGSRLLNVKDLYNKAILSAPVGRMDAVRMVMDNLTVRG